MQDNGPFSINGITACAFKITHRYSDASRSRRRRLSHNTRSLLFAAILPIYTGNCLQFRFEIDRKRHVVLSVKVS